MLLTILSSTKLNSFVLPVTTTLAWDLAFEAEK